MGNKQSRKWNLVINNPLDNGMNHDVIIGLLNCFCPEYYCLSDEFAGTGTFHTHVFIYSPSPIRFSTLKKRFPTAHIEKAYGSAKENREYIRKEGKWADTDKAETIVAGSFYEHGHLPDEKAEATPMQYSLIQALYDGRRTAEIVKENPSLVFKVKDIDILRQTLMSERYGKEFRQLEVSYLFGSSGTGKTRSIYHNHSANDICRITNYHSGKGVVFDNYTGQNVIVFEEFASQIPIEEMLNYLDIYPLTLPARYSDKVACYTIVYITSNIPLELQYLNIQHTKPETWRAFLRRIHHVTEYLKDGTKREITLEKE